MSKLQDELRKKFATPQAALRALGLDVSLLEGPRLAKDEKKDDHKKVFRALKAAFLAERP